MERGENHDKNEHEEQERANDRSRLAIIAAAVAAGVFTAFAAMQSGQEAVTEVGPGIPSSNN